MQKLHKLIEILLLLMIGLPALLGILFLLSATGDTLWTEKASGWAQAIGAVAAIYFSYRAGLKQGEDALKMVREADKIAASRKFDAVVAVVDTAEAYARRISNVFPDGSASYLGLSIEYSERFMSDLMDSLQVIPAHELGTYETVSAFLALRNAMHDLRTNVDRAHAKFENTREGDSYASLIRFDRSGIDLCIGTIERSAKSLRAARIVLDRMVTGD